MTQRDDQMLVDYLFDELSEEDAATFEQGLEDDAALSSEVEGLGETLDTMRTLEDEEPPDWLSAKVLAEARQVADEAAEEAEKKSLWGRLRRWMWGPAGGLIGVGAAAVALAVVVTPQMLEEQAPASADQIAYELGRQELDPAAPTGRPVEAPATPAVAEDEKEAAVAAELTPARDVSAKQEAAKAPVALKPSPKKRSKTRRRAGPAPTDDLRVAKTAESAPGQGSGDGLGVGDLSGGKRDFASGAGGAAAPTPSAPAAVPAPAPRSPARRAPSRAAEAPAPAQEEAGLLDLAEKKKAKDASETAAQHRAIAMEFLKAARGEVARDELEAARRVLARGLERLRDRPERGWMYLERARIERAAGDLSAARRDARAAYAIAGFEGRGQARSLLEELEREAAPPAAASPP